MTKDRAPAQCAICGADIPPRAQACPECGADDRTGWREQSVYDGLNLPDEEMPPAVGRKGPAVFWWLTAVALLAGVALLVFANRF